LCGTDYKGKGRRLAINHDPMPVNSGGKPMNESLSDANKEATSTKAESKQSISDNRPKEGQSPKPILISNYSTFIVGGS
jgi:ribosome-binding protein aMBF1 (putative translation factor)